MQLGTLNIRRTENKNFASCQFHIVTPRRAWEGCAWILSRQFFPLFVLCLDTEQRELPAHCLFLPWQRDILSRDKWCLQPRSRDKNEAEDNALNFQYIYMMCVSIHLLYYTKWHKSIKAGCSSWIKNEVPVQSTAFIQSCEKESMLSFSSRFSVSRHNENPHLSLL